MKLYPELKHLGLTDSDIRVYLSLLELGTTTISRLAKKSGVKRTTVYLIIDSLKQKGLVSASTKAGKTHFYAQDPRTLGDIMEERKRSIDKIIPQLLSFTNLLDKKPQIRYFEGNDGIKEVLRDALNYPGQEICMWYSDSYVHHFEPTFFLDYYIPKRKEKKISVRAILPDSEAVRKANESNVSHLKQVRMFPSGTYSMSIEIDIYGDNKIGILSFEEEFGLIIESKKIHDSLKSIFETMWMFGKS
ncbi:MAG: transcriptional regulator, TrmB [uncultured bacterium]|uniref:Transcriptional regulator, TrmB n=1 Tax=Candidatus Wolfebacteria bacterium GW2011_GWC2_39_22 TaxID=1619013 RepID=A0A0G0NHJ3_9BACT|nr:MAG: transcriptional regulator, TrmB [uncultured bacterium]KKR12281.1 MAG: Transcriptional regulator, TrmB [Candidatus Wolfebacteria bacterium GW2011_GWC2_39_22]HBI25912.1 hypothetical protein [Candidatus Wolfebacteria bacterium]